MCPCSLQWREEVGSGTLVETRKVVPAVLHPCSICEAIIPEWETKPTAGTQTSSILPQCTTNQSTGCHKRTEKQRQGKSRVGAFLIATLNTLENCESLLWIKYIQVIWIVTITSTPSNRHPVIPIAWRLRSATERLCPRREGWEEGGRPSRAWRGYCWAIAPWLTQQITISKLWGRNMGDGRHCHTSVLWTSVFIWQFTRFTPVMRELPNRLPEFPEWIDVRVLKYNHMRVALNFDVCMAVVS